MSEPSGSPSCYILIDFMHTRRYLSVQTTFQVLVLDTIHLQGIEWKHGYNVE